jgi:cell wall-associated NlpC family hydrolase
MSALDFYMTLPFKPKGRDAATGVDCWGLVRLFYQRELGISLESFEGTSVTNLSLISDLVRKHRDTWERVAEPQINDVVLMKARTADGSYKRVLSSHLGVVIRMSQSTLGILHSEHGIGTHVDALSSLRISHRILEYRRYRDG